MNTTKKRMYRWLFSLGQILPIVASNLRLMEICAWYAQFCLNYYKIMPCVFDPSLVKYLRIEMSGAFVLKKFADFLAHIKLNTKDRNPPIKSHLAL